jgi:hypothetical protein
MKNKIRAVCCGLLLAIIAQSAIGADWKCQTKPVEPCFRHHGRLTSRQGIALTIWLIGTTRVVGVSDTETSAIIEKYLEITSPNHSYIYGDFDICPLGPDRPGHMRRVCVAGAERLVVQDVLGARPPSRLLSTWPADKR